MANKFYGAIALIGGTDGAIDKINDAVLTVADGAYAILTSERIHTYVVDGSGAAEDSPRIIAPDSGSVKRYKLNSVVAKSLYMYENAEYLYGVTSADAEEGLLRINSSDDTEIRAITGQSVDIIINSTKVADFSASGLSGATIVSPIINTILTATAKTGAVFTEDGAAELYYNEVKMLETTTTGIGVTGAVDAIQAIFTSGTNDIYMERNRLNAGYAADSDNYPLRINYEGYASGVTRFRDTIIGDGKTGVCANFVGNGAAELYYAGTKILDTQPAGVKIYDGTATGIFIGYDSDDADCVNFDPGGKWQFRARNGADAATNTLIIGDPDGSVDLYYAGFPKIQTSSFGFTFGNGLTASLTQASAEVHFTSSGHGDFIVIEGEDAGGTLRSIFKGDPDSAAELYYAGTKKFETVLNGIQITGDGDVNGSELRLVSDDSTVTNQLGQVRFGNTTDDALVILRGICDGAADSGRFEILTEPTGGGADFAAIFNSGGSVQLYHAGVKAVETEATGLAIQDTSGSSVKVDLKSDAGASVGYLLCANGAWTIYDSTNTDAILTSNAAGGVDLYYAGSKIFQTYSDGIFFGSSLEGYLHHDGTTCEIYSYGHGDAIQFRGENAGGTAKAVFNGDPDGATTLYYAGTEVAKTGSGSFEAQADSSQTLGAAAVCWSNIYGDAGVTSCSDPKYKKNVQTTTLGLEFINDLVPIAFKFKKTGKRPKKHNRTYHGLMASDVEAALEDHGLSYDDFAGLEFTEDDDGDRWLGLKYEQFVAPLIKAVQELTAKVEALEAK